MGNNNVCCRKDDGEITQVYIDDSNDQKGTFGNEQPSIFEANKLAFTAEAIELIEKQGSTPGQNFARLDTIDGGYYSGQITNGKREGFGTQRLADGSVFVGQWKDNLPEGLGQMTYTTERRTYTGEFKRGRCHGHGVGVSEKEGYTIHYVGQYVNDFANGFGEEQWDDGSRYTGEFKDGQKHGHGVYFWSDGGVYRGSWVHNEIEGFGHYHGAKGRVFQGEWRGSIKHGYGSHFWDGQLYDGCYENDKKSGFGVFTWTDKKMYLGYWDQGSQDGPGVVADAQDRYKLTLWNKGQRVVSKDHPADFKTYEAEFKEGHNEEGVKGAIKQLREQTEKAVYEFY